MLTGHDRGKVLVAGSHGGLIAGTIAAEADVLAVILNDAGVGKDNAGIASLALLESIGMAAATVDRRSVTLGKAALALATGIISHANGPARACGVKPGDTCMDAAKKLCHAQAATGTLPHYVEIRFLLDSSVLPPPVIGCDTVCLVQEDDAGKILVCGSHAALHSPDLRQALIADAAAAFFHDAGSLGEPEGISRLPVLDTRGIAAAAVDYRTARIGDALSMWETGRLSFLNTTAAKLGWHCGMSLPEAVAQYRQVNGLA